MCCAHVLIYHSMWIERETEREESESESNKPKPLWASCTVYTVQ